MSFPRGFTFIQLRRFQYQMAITKLEDRLISDDLPVTRPCLLTGSKFELSHISRAWGRVRAYT